MKTCLNPFAIHYFLWFAALTSIYGYVSEYAEHYANASSSQYGLLNMILTFITIFAKLFFCSLADRHRAHRSMFVIFLTLALIGFGSFGVLPFFVEVQPKDKGLNHLNWYLICAMTTIATISMGVISCLSDAFAMHSASKNKTSYGFIRLWGTIGWGLSAILLAFINQSKALPHLVPGLLVLIALIFLDTLVASLWPNKKEFQLNSSTGLEFESLNTSRSVEDSRVLDANYGATHSIVNKTIDASLNSSSRAKEQDISGIAVQWVLFKEVAHKRKSLFRYMTLFTISGALISLQWSYFFLYLNQIYPEDFSFISSLSMIGQSFFGELPFFILSKLVIQNIGRSHTLSVSILSIGLRYLLYQILLPGNNMYYVLLTESLQGPSFGLFYVVMTEVGLDYSDCKDAIKTAIDKGFISDNPSDIRKLQAALCATMQSLMSACYEGLGLGVGSIIGGLLIDYYGFHYLWQWSSILAIVLGLLNILVDVMKIPALMDQTS